MSRKINPKLAGIQARHEADKKALTESERRRWEEEKKRREAEP